MAAGFLFRRWLAFAAALVGIASSSGTALGCEADEMATNDFGFVLKVVAGSDKIQAVREPGSVETVYTLELLLPYFVICRDGEYFRISDLPAQTVAEAEAGQTGYVLRDQVHIWSTREALSFGPYAWAADRVPVKAWETEDTLLEYLRTNNESIAPPTYVEKLEDTLGRERDLRPYPVLSSDVGQLFGRDKRYFEVLIPAYVPGSAGPSGGAAILEGGAGALERAEGILLNSTFVIAFDATGSMESVARLVAEDIRAAFDGLPDDVRSGSRIGFVFFRDAGDREKILEVPPLPVDDAMEALLNVAPYMSGGDDIAEPILDALYVAGLLYDWEGDGEQEVGGRMIIGVLNGDAKLETRGEIDSRVPPGLNAVEVARQIAEHSIGLLTVQAGLDAGPNLTVTLQALADTAGGQFIGWGAGDRAERVSGALADGMSSRGETVYGRGEDAIDATFYKEGLPAIPLDVVDAEMLDRLRSAGIQFNIDTAGGVLVRAAYMLENLDLLEPQIEIEKETIQDLINLLGVLATAGADPENMMTAARSALATIAGEDVDFTLPISQILQQQLGIQFRTNLLNFDLNFLLAMTPAERLLMGQRLQQASDELTNFYQANLGDFDARPAVWMPVAHLP